MNQFFQTTEVKTPIDQYLPEPRSYKALSKLPDKIFDQWIKSARAELSQLINVGTFDTATFPSENDQVIPTMMIYKAKVNSQGYLDKLKCRCVAR